MDEVNRPTPTEVAAYLSLMSEKPPFADVGYEPKTKLWGRFSVEDVAFNPNRKDIEKLYDMCFKEYKDDKVIGTELSMVLNWKIWQWYEKNRQLAEVYDKLWKEFDEYVMTHWKGEDLQYYIRTTD